ncbi:MAG: carboxypeptidase regulatory-like domain-containing protein [Rudaea sp.]|uniref:carboxypeptidase regulatory-like domain-containing protein n=1 Tax=Rudaea sp. TaxID=2136325 RepID=UPI0039E3073A
MNAPTLVILALGLAAAFGVWRTHGRHRVLRAVLQPVAALLLYLCLFPPTASEHFAADELVVLTPGVTARQVAALPLAANVVALPGVEAGGAIERAPDLGTALRRHADARRLRIVGGGLPDRDRDAARGRVARFNAAPLPRGLVELDAPAFVLAGHRWRVGGRAEGVAGGRAELRDPAGAVVAAGPLDAQGRFALGATAKGEGDALFALQLFDQKGTRVETVSVPLATRVGAPLRVLLLAGAPDPESKYLRRWAVDAGVALDSRIALSEGIALNEGAVALDVDALRNADLAILDERAWATLDASHRLALIAAVRDGLGLLLRVNGPVPAAVAADWAAFGLRVQAAEAMPPVVLDKTLGLGDPGVTFAPRAFAVEAPRAAPLLRADDGSPVAWSVDAGRGRVVLWLLSDSYKLVLHGEAAAFGSVWSDTFAAVARARGESVPALPDTARVDERAVLCGLAADAAVVDETGTRTPLLVGADRCAGYWPSVSGWHVLLNSGERWPFPVRTDGEAAGVAAAHAARATRGLLGAAASPAGMATRGVPLPRWPFFLAWLAAAATLWWFERRAIADDGATGG